MPQKFYEGLKWPIAFFIIFYYCYYYILESSIISQA